MANGQTPASPAEVDIAGLPEILVNPSLVPEARVFYSSSPDAQDNIAVRPDAPEDIQFAVILDSAKQSPNGKTEEITHASRFIALQDGHQESANGQDFVILDHGLAVKGLKWIRKNVPNDEIHRSAIETKTYIEKHSLAQTPSKPSVISAARSQEPDPSEQEADKTNEIKAKFQEDLEIELEEASEYCVQRETDSGLTAIKELVRELRPDIATNGEINTIRSTKAFNRQMRTMVAEFGREPAKLTEFLTTVLDMEAFVDTKNPNGILRGGLNGIFNGLAKGFSTATYRHDVIKEYTLKWLELYEGLQPDRYFEGEQDRRAEFNEPAIGEKAIFASMEYGALTILNTLEEMADRFSHPEEVIQGMYSVVSAGVHDLNRANKVNFCAHVMRELLRAKPLAVQYLKGAPDLRASESAIFQAMDLHFVLPEIGVQLKKVGFEDIERRGLPDEFTEKAFLRAFPAHKDLINRRLPLDKRLKKHQEITGRIIQERMKFIQTFLSGNAKSFTTTLYNKVRISGKKFTAA